VIDSPLAYLPASVLIAEVRRRIAHGLLDPGLEADTDALLRRVEEAERTHSPR